MKLVAFMAPSIFAGLMALKNADELAGWGLKWWGRISRKKKQVIAPEESVPTRFIKLFEAHGVHKNQIPVFFGHGLTISDLSSQEVLLQKLSEEVLSDACKLFNIRREWLDGVDEQIYPENDFYKRPEEFEKFLCGFGDIEKLRGVLLFPEEPSPDYPYALMILGEPVGNIGDKVIHRYYICNGWVYNYWKSQAYLTACVAIAWKHHAYIIGRYTSHDLIKSLSFGQCFLEYKIDTALPVAGRMFYPEDMALKPDDYMVAITPEDKGYGAVNALELWLRLHSEGFMETGLPYPSEEIRGSFQNRLNEIQDQYPESGRGTL